MKTVELRSLLTNKPKEITIPGEIKNAFDIWKKKINKENVEPLEIFYAGYILANPIVRDLYKESELLNKRN